MKANSIEELVMALRCSARPRQESDSCVDCPYRVLEDLTEFAIDMAFPPTDVVNGVPYWETCDCEQMAIDAAEMLERLNEIPLILKE